MLDSESGALEAGSAAPRLCNLEQEAAPLSASSHLPEARGHRCHSQGKGMGVPYLLNSPFPIPPFIHLLSPHSGHQSPE